MTSKTSQFVAELIGTFALIFIGAGSVATQGWSNGAVSLVGIALAHGFVICAMIYAFGHISGTHINPAVTVSMMVTRKIEIGQGISYIVAQLIGATLAGFALGVIFPDKPNWLGTTDLSSGISSGTGVMIEAILTFFLVTVIFGAAVDDRSAKGFAGIAIGLTIAMDIFMGGPLTGASMNPARTFGPAVASGHFDNHIVYWVGPLLGGVAAGLLHQSLLRKES